MDPDRREACRASLRLFCETYNPEAFSLGWSDDHLKAIARIEEAAVLGALYAFAMPRGSGKTTICRMAALWAASYHLRRYVFVIGANAAKAEDTLDALKLYCRFLPLYAEDFPEVSWPARCLGGIANRASGQTCRGNPTLIEWAKDRLVLPTVPPPANWPKHWPLRADGLAPTSGGVVSTSGLTGDGIRGSLLTLTTGESIRPDLVLLDDPQTNESAHSRTQNATREQLVSADVLGMAGPGRSIAAVMPCTVIAPGDFVDCVLDREKHPLWRGERTSLLKAMPEDLAAWEDYFDVYRRCAQLEPPDFAEANALYEAHRQVLDRGAVAAWEERKLPSEVSAVQHAMHLYCRSPRAFYAEYQNDPRPEDLGVGVKDLVPAEVAARLTGVPRGTVPRECPMVTAFIDPGGYLIWYLVAGWTARFGGAVLDYGTWPRQARPVFENRTARDKLADRYPGHGESERVYAGVRDLAAEILGRSYLRDGDGSAVKVDRCLVDAGYEPGAVYQFCRRADFPVYASKGIGRSSTSKGVNEWPVRDGERGGHHWRLTAGKAGGGRTVQFDPDAWKSFVAERLAVPLGGPTALALWGKDAAAHELVAAHCAAEYAVQVTYRGATFDKWQVRPGAPDNHWWDCLTGAAVAASVNGLVWSPTGDAAAKPRKKVSIRDLYDRARKDGAP